MVITNCDMFKIVTYFWPTVAAELQIGFKECQDFLLHFHDNPGMYGLNSSWGGPSGTMISMRLLRENVNTLHAAGSELPIQVELVWAHLDSITPTDADYLWLMNWNDNGPSLDRG